MLLRAAFLFLFLFLSAASVKANNCPIALFEPIRAAKDKIQGFIGGASKCPIMTERDLKALECRAAGPDFRENYSASESMNGIAVGEFFQGLARNSHHQAKCRLGVLNKYFSDSNARSAFNVKAEQAFNRIHKKLRALVLERNKLQANLNRMKTEAAADRAMSLATYKGREQHQKSIDRVGEQIARLLTTVPLGYDPEVGQAFIQMSLGSKFEANLLAEGIKNAAPKYKHSIGYYQSKLDDGQYCLGIDYRNLAGKSGQVSQWLRSFPNQTPEERSLKHKLSCRLDAHYETGNERFRNGVIIAGFATYMLPPAWIPRAGGALIGAAELVARGGAAIVALMSMDAMRAQCFPPTGVISGDLKCDAEKDFARVIQEPNLTRCAGVVAMNLSLAGEAKGVSTAIKAAKAAKRGKAPAIAK